MIDYAVNSSSKEGQGHTIFQAPEIDGKTFFTNPFPPGNIFQAKVKKLKDSFDIFVQ